MHGMISGAKISSCEMYRYTLWRTWDSSKPILVWVMLNPSIADHSKNDPTIIRCINFAKAFGYGGIIVVNMFAYRASNPGRLLGAHDIIGPKNDAEIQAAMWGKDVVAAWGSHGDVHRARVNQVMPILKVAKVCYCLGRTKTGQPRHPLMMRKDKELEAFDGC